jgi:ketosteroid isomerase-like protein
MNKEEIDSAIRVYVDALENNDVEKALSFFSDDAVWLTPEGEFKGRDEIKRYLTWITKTIEDLKFEDTGIGIAAENNKAVYEYIGEGLIRGKKAKIPSVCIYEFKNGKCAYHKTIYDRLSLAKQAATGWLARRVVNSVINQSEQGLH